MSKPRIVVLDDVEQIRVELANYLSESYEVQVVATIDQAVDAIRDAELSPCQVVVSDMRLEGDKKGGLRLAQDLSFYERRPEIIILTGHPGAEDFNELMEFGIFNYIVKFKGDWLDEVVGNLESASQKWQEKNLVRTRNVLFLDEEEDIAASLKSSLEDHLELVFCRTIDEALSTIAEQTIDVAISDVELAGDRIGGIRFGNELSKLPEPPAFYLVGTFSTADPKGVLDSGAKGLIEKNSPVLLPKLIEICNGNKKPIVVENYKFQAQGKFKVLFLAAQPDAWSQMDLKVEANRLISRANEFDNSMTPVPFQVIPVFAESWNQVVDSLLQHDPEVVHFAGHGANGAIVLNDENDAYSQITPTQLRELFEVYESQKNKRIRLVVLNVCESKPVAEEIRHAVDCAIGMRTRISDHGAIEFAARFYERLGSQSSVKDAFDMARIVLDGNNEIEEKIPDLQYAPGINPAEEFFAK